MSGGQAAGERRPSGCEGFARNVRWWTTSGSAPPSAPCECDAGSDRAMSRRRPDSRNSSCRSSSAVISIEFRWRSCGASLGRSTSASTYARSRGGDLDRLLNRHHSALHELVAQAFSRMSDWRIAPEVSFAVFADRGVIDILAWHAANRSLLVIELKTEIVDVQETIGTLDRKHRIAATVARERGWHPTTISTWLIVASSRTNRRRIQAHASVLRAAFPEDRRGTRPSDRRSSGPPPPRLVQG